MKNKQQHNTLAFAKAVVTELNDQKAFEINGGTSPIVVSAINEINQTLEELREKAQQALQTN